VHFDHTFKADLHTTSGEHFTDTFGESKFSKRPITVVCKGNAMDLIEDVGISSRKQVEIPYPEVSQHSL